MHVLITGVTGFIGGSLAAALRARGDRVTGISRTPQGHSPDIALPKDPSGWAAALEGVDAVVNLAGAPIASRWSTAYKQTMRDSRVLLTTQLAEGIALAQRKATVLVSSSAVGYYGCSEDDDTELDESAPCGADFLGATCRDWEAATEKASEQGVRVVQLRIGVVLELGGGALSKMLPPFRLGVGGPAGGGRQWLSWIHREDVVRMILWAIDQPEVSGPVNGTAPGSQNNKDFSRTLASVLRRPCLFPMPGFMLGLMMGEGALLVTHGQRVVPRVATEGGFKFTYPELKGALEAILS